MNIKSILVGAASALLCVGHAQAAGTPAQKCQSGKNQAVGKYVACRLKAEAKLAINGDAVAYGEALTKCDSRYASKWPALEQTAVDAGGSCPSTGDQTSIQDFTDACNDAIATKLGGGSLPLDVTTCNSNLSTCNTSLGTCTTNYSTCSSNLSTCNAGTAVAADVLAGKTFSSSAGLNVTGTATAGSNVSGADGSLSMTIPDGFYSGSKTATASDSDLLASNIKYGVNLFGVIGSSPPAQPLRTGQTLCYNSSDTVTSCAGTGQDGDTLKGVTRGYTDNGNGTVTDNKTGLIWEKLDNNNANGIHDYNVRTYNWDNAFKRVQVLNGNIAGCVAANNPDACCTGAGTGSCSAFAGQTDWRLPNINELQTLINWSTPSPSVDVAFNTSCVDFCTATSCSCTLTSGYWSSTSVSAFSGSAWLVGFYLGHTHDDAKTSNYNVRAVRGGS